MRKFEDLTYLSQRGTLHKTHTGQFIWLLWLIIMKLIQKSLPGLSQGKQYLHAVYTRGDHSELRVKKRMKNKIDSVFFSLSHPSSLPFVDWCRIISARQKHCRSVRPPARHTADDDDQAMDIASMLAFFYGPTVPRSFHPCLFLSRSSMAAPLFLFVRFCCITFTLIPTLFFQISLVCHITRIPATCLQHHELYMIISSLKSSQTAWP